MIQSLQLENFKAFGKRVEIPCAPITLIFGENSAGKSSILQALCLLKQTRESGEAGALFLPRAEGGHVELGSFQEVLFDHDSSRILTVGVGFEPEKRFLGPPFLWVHNSVASAILGGSMALELSLSRRNLRQDIRLERIGISFGGAKGAFARFKPLKAGAREDAGRGSSRKPEARCYWVTEDPDDWKRFFEVFLKVKERFIPLWKNPPRLELDLEWNDKKTKKTRRKRNSDYNRAVRVYSSDLTLDEFMRETRKRFMETRIVLDGFVPIEQSRGPGFTPLMEIGDIAVMAGEILDDRLRHCFPMGPIRKVPERWYIDSGTAAKNVGSRGEFLPNLLFRSPGLLKAANRWLKRLDIGYELKVTPLGPRYKDLLEVVLVDTRKREKVEVNLSDVGFGISQILPFIVQSLAGREQIISIEQPEIHIHPRLQADLGDLVAHTIKPPYGHQFLIETHSEHLVLRMQRLVRTKKIKPEDVSILFVSRGREGSDVKRLRLDEDGDFIDEWPGGFFPERLRELR
jgi:hypothetical protein